MRWQIESFQVVFRQVRDAAVIKRALTLTVTLFLISIMLAAVAFTPSATSADALYFKTITINSGQVPSTQTDFPLLISQSDATLKSVSNGGHVANSDGSDIYFTNSVNTIQYSYEIEKYDSSTGTLVAWVKVPSLSDGAVIKMWYGGSGGGYNNPANVWDSSFKGVWHMSQTDVQDSTSNGNNGNAANESEITLSASGKIDGTDIFKNYDNAHPPTYSDYINCGTTTSLDFSSTGKYTWLAWVDLTADVPGGGSGIIGKATKNGSGYDIYLKRSGYLTIQDSSTQSGPEVTTDAALSSTSGWAQVCVTYDGTLSSNNVVLYINASASGTGTLTTLKNDALSDLYIGYRRTVNPNNGNGLFPGSIDEVEYSTVVRSADWILTAYNNQNDPASFYSVSGETAVPTPTPTPTLTPTPTPTATATGGTTSVTVTRYASDGTTILGQTTRTYQWMEANLPVYGDGVTHYYLQGPVFIDGLNESAEQALRWNPEEDTNVQDKDIGAVRGSNVKDICNLVGGATAGDTIKIKASDGLSKTFAYKNVYEYSSREGPMVLIWYKDGLSPDTGYDDGMRLSWFADDGVNPWGIHVFGDYDWYLAADPTYWYYYVSGSEKYPTTTGLSVKYVSAIMIYSSEAPPTPTPTPTTTSPLTPTPTPTSTSTPTPTTATPEETLTPTPTEAATPTVAPIETPTSEPTAVPISTSTPSSIPAKDNGGIGAGVIAGITAMALVVLVMLTWLIVLLRRRRVQ